MGQVPIPAREMRAGADLNLLLRGNAVNDAVKGQALKGLKFGGRQQKHGPRLADDVAGLINKDVGVYIVAEDVDERGLEKDELISGLRPVPRAELPALFESHDRVWHW